MSYQNKGLKKTNEVKLRLDDYEIDDLELAMGITGEQRAVWIRKIVMREVELLLATQDFYESTISQSSVVH